MIIIAMIYRGRRRRHSDVVMAEGAWKVATISKEMSYERNAFKLFLHESTDASKVSESLVKLDDGKWASRLQKRLNIVQHKHVNLQLHPRL